MGIENMHLLVDPESQTIRKEAVSRYIVEEERFKYVFGWDQPLQSFYLQVHDNKIIDPDNNPVHWLGADSETRMYEVEALCRAAETHGLYINYNVRLMLYSDKDDGR